jgi:hypothetical protein
MDPVLKEKFLLYARTKKQVAELEATLDTLKGELLQEMLAIDGEATKIETDLGNFSVKTLKKWQFPESIVIAEETLKKEKDVAKQTGAATFEEEQSLYFRSAGGVQ